MKYFIFLVLSIFFMISTLCGCQRVFDKIFDFRIRPCGTAYINDVKYEAVDSIRILGPKAGGATMLLHYENNISQLKMFYYNGKISYLIKFYFCSGTALKIPIEDCKYTVIYKRGANDYGDKKKELDRFIDSLHTEHPDSSFCIAILQPGWRGTACSLEGSVYLREFESISCIGNFVLKTNYESVERYNINGNFNVYYKRWNQNQN